jgi:hypothetical protein
MIIINTFLEIKVQDRRLRGYKDKSQRLLHELKVRFDDLQKFKACFIIMDNPFTVDVIPRILLSETSALMQKLNY